MNDQAPEADGETEGKALSVVRWLTEKAIQGVPPLLSAQSLADEYLIDQGFPDHGARIDSLINWETSKNFTSGFLAGLGGILTLAITIPASFGASWIVQARMSAAIAKISGYDILSDRVQTFVVLALVGVAVKDVVKNTGIHIGKGLAKSMLNQLPGKVLMQINKQVGYRLITKAGTTGSINLVKAIPLVGGVIGGSVDAYMCRAVGKKAKALFYQPYNDEREESTAQGEEVQ